MKKILLYTIIFALLPASLLAKAYTVDEVPNVRRINAREYVSDPEKILSEKATMRIDTLLSNLEHKTGIETVVTVLPSIGENDSFDFAYSLGKAWGVGKKKKDNGLIILLVIDQRRIQFATGYGLEGVLPDAICKRIQTETMFPALKNGDWDTGMVNGVQAVCGQLDGSMQNDGSGNNKGMAGPFYTIFIFLGIFALSFALIYVKNRKANCCPKCGKHQLQRSGSQVISRSEGIKTEMITYTCRNCGHKVIRQQKTYDDNYRGHGFGGPFIGGIGGFGGGNDGGGFSGGSFGGGDFGGGGSGTSF
jgi:uncharacterized protein